MKILTKTLLATLAATLILAGCGTTGEAEKEKPATPPAATTPAGGATTSPGEKAGAEKPMETKKEEPKNPLTDPNNILSQHIVYFDFDSSAIKSDAMNVIKAHGEYLAKHPDIKITLEGHTDERGTREYNIALGERRADAVRRVLMSQGVAASQLNVISYGEERPAKLGHDESAWRYNRRVVFDYPGM